MSALAIVEALDVIEYVSSGLVSSEVVSAIDTLTLEQGEEALHGGIVLAISASAHAALNTVLFEQRLIIIT